MKSVVLIFFLFSSVIVFAHIPKDSVAKIPDTAIIIDTVKIDSVKVDSLKAIALKADTIKTDSLKANSAIPDDTMPAPVKVLKFARLTAPGARNSYGDLLNDDPVFNP